MSHLSPCVFLLWSVLSVCLTGFFIYHIWKYDQFRCLNFWRARKAAFKRFMTYSYILVIPVLLIYMFSFAAIKYAEGWIVLPNGQVFPKPFQLWTERHRSLYFPLNVLWTLSWVSESTTHLEELFFWLYLIHSGSTPKPWFKSIYFRLWLGGVVSSTIILLAVTISTKADPLRNEASMQLAGSLIGLLITLGFLPVLWVFPNFIRSVRAEGGDLEAIIRLAKFHDLNIIRTIFRFIFIIPVLMLSIDGMTPHTHELNTVLVSADLLSIVSGIGCIIQSAITLVIFFPRNVELETQRWLDPQSSSRSRSRSQSHSYSQRSSKRFLPGSRSTIQVLPSQGAKIALTDSPEQSKADLTITPAPAPGQRKGQENKTYTIPLYTMDPSPLSPSPLSPSQMSDYPPHPYSSGYNRHRPDEYYHDTPSPHHHKANNNAGSHGVNRYNSGVVQSALTEANMRIFEGTIGRVNPMALYFTSPIDIYDEGHTAPVRRRRMAYP